MDLERSATIFQTTQGRPKEVGRRTVQGPETRKKISYLNAPENAPNNAPRKPVEAPLKASDKGRPTGNWTGL